MKHTTTQKDKEEMQALRAKGWGYRKIGEKFGISMVSAYYNCNPDKRKKSNQQVATRKKALRLKAIALVAEKLRAKGLDELAEKYLKQAKV